MDLSHVARREVFSAAWARAAGLDSDAVARAVVDGRAHPLLRGWYATRAPLDDTDWNRLASRAAFLHFGGRAMVSHQSALVWASLPVMYAGLRTVHLTRTVPGSSRRRRGLMLHRSVAGVPKGDRVPLAVAIVQSGLVAEPLTALIAADAALHAEKVDGADLEEALDLLGGSRHITPVRAMLDHADGRIQSPGESIAGHRLRQLGWQVEPQFTVETDEGAVFADFRIVGTRVLVEVDGKVKYRGDDGPDALFREKRREDAIRRKDWRLVRLVMAELDDLPLIEGRVNEQVAGAAA
ncbi:hypothetical protein [Intrasporangium calvum]|uniref:DUF559 domain-containing protein n=1 Tax=Intrasporangium calvum (strain ATCC 23552 / DSM 43043 / JCM 3097 / NBRC 12989 / NCIMB 10167 / NRRL B-3866 / 7 KIP) TaxID=710696 RepID=E6SB30_INTC7|nr:hypothetical protein [Intrasporangium calvum]ADU47291.1 hypothetical protein Intca_0747 [Intrasporangium calvum DSM 43043]